MCVCVYLSSKIQEPKQRNIDSDTFKAKRQFWGPKSLVKDKIMTRI